MLKNILSVLGGAVGAQLVALLAAPVITRIYLPEEFGRMTAVWALIGVVGVVASLSYEKTIVLEHNDADARQLLVLCAKLALVVAALVSGCIYLFDRYIDAEYFDVEHAALFVFLGVYVVGVGKAIDFYVTRNNHFRLIAVSMLLGSVFTAIWKVTAGLGWSASAEMLLTGNIIGIMVPAAALFWYSRASIRAHPGTGAADELGLLQRYSEFPKKQVPNALLNTLQQQAPVFILAAYFGSELVGFYGLAMAVLLRPVRALAEAVSRVYLKRVSRLAREDQRDDLLKVTGWLGLFALPFCIVLFFYGETLFGLLFGKDWGDAGRMASLMAPWVFMLIANVPTTQTLIVRRALKFILVFNAVYLLVRVSGLVATIYLTGNVYSAILVFSLIGFFANVIYISRGLAVARNG